MKSQHVRSWMRNGVGVGLCALAILLLGTAPALAKTLAPDTAGVREAFSAAKLLESDGKFAEAREAYARLLFGTSTDAPVKNEALLACEPLHDGVRDAVLRYVTCLDHLKRWDDADAFLERTARVYAAHWPVLERVAVLYAEALPHCGTVISGKFLRQGLVDVSMNYGEYLDITSRHRDRVRAMQLMAACVPGVQETAKSADAAQQAAAAWFFIRFADFILADFHDARRLQELTDLTQLPPFGREPDVYLPRNDLDAAGNPIFFTVPASFEAAKNDGQRARWCLTEAVKMLRHPAAAAVIRTEADYRLAMYALQLYGTPTQPPQLPGDKLRTLRDGEILTPFRGQGKTVTLPEDYDFFHIFRTQAANGTHRKFHALFQLASAYCNRDQGVPAAECLRQILETYPKTGVPAPSKIIPEVQAVMDAAAWNRGGFPSDKLNLPAVRHMHEQLTKNWGNFGEDQEDKPAGGATFTFHYRNAKEVKFTATKVKIDLLFDDIARMHKEIENQSPIPPDRWNKNWDTGPQTFEQLGLMLVLGQQRKYLADESVTWEVDLEPVEGHTQRTQKISLPTNAAGAYFVQAQVEDGNATAVVLWVSDLVLVKKDLIEAGERNVWLFVADAVTGKPVPGAKISGMAYRASFNQTSLETSLKTESLQTVTDDTGQCHFPASNYDSRDRWMLVAQKPNAETPDSRTAFIGFSSLWDDKQPTRTALNAPKVFGITDRPLYRPGKVVRFRFLANVASYANTGKSMLAGREFRFWLEDPNRRNVELTKITADALGGLTGEFEIPHNATLGKYTLKCSSPLDTDLRLHFDIPRDAKVEGQVTFLVEEYRKPEFEITVAAPTQPILLGEKFKATVQARYYHGQPVTRGTLKYIVTREKYTHTWYPPARWDWLYGPGYGWRQNRNTDPNWSPTIPGLYRRESRKDYRQLFGGMDAPPDNTVLEKEIDLEEYFRDASPEQMGVFELEVDTTETQNDLSAAEIQDYLERGYTHEEIAAFFRTDLRYTISVSLQDQSRREVKGEGEVIATREPFRIYAWADEGYVMAGQTIRFHATARTIAERPVTGTGTLTVFRRTYNQADDSWKETPAFTKEIATSPDGEILQTLRLTAPGQYRLAFSLPADNGKTVTGTCVRTVAAVQSTGDEQGFRPLELTLDKCEYAPGENVKLLINTDLAAASVMLFARVQNGDVMQPTLISMTGKSKVVELPVTRDDMPNFFITAFTVSAAEVHTDWCEVYVPPVEKTLVMEILPDCEHYLPGDKAKAKIRLTTADGTPHTGAVVVTIYDKSLEYISGGSLIPDIHAHFWKWVRSHSLWTGDDSASRSTSPLPLPGSPVMDQLHLIYPIPETFRTFSLHAIFPTGGSHDPSNVEQLFGAGGSGGIMGGSGGFMGFSGMGGGSIAPACEPDEPTAAQSDTPATKLVEAVLRSTFADTAFWVAHLETDENGEATIELDMPDNLTTWKIRAWAMGDGASVGSASAEVITRKNILLRMQMPRFMTVGDHMTLSANVHNYLSTDKDVTVILEADEAGPLSLPADTTRKVTIPAGGEARIDWQTQAVRSGECVLRMKALTDEESDAMENRFPIQVHGSSQRLAFSGTISPRPADSTSAATVSFTLPTDIHPDESTLAVNFSPSLATAIIEAIPYLTDYPHGCTEQTLNRFLPTVLARKTLMDLDLNLENIRLYHEELAEKQREEAAQRNPRRLAERSYMMRKNPVFDRGEADSMAEAGVKKLAEMQCADGGWGWFSGAGEKSSPHLTALVFRGLMLAQQTGVPVPPQTTANGRQWLESYMRKQLAILEKNEDAKTPDLKFAADSLDALVFFTLAESGALDDGSPAMKEMRQRLFADRRSLSRVAQTMFALALTMHDENAEYLGVMLKDLSAAVRIDTEKQLAVIEQTPSAPWWDWTGNDIETHAMFLRLLCVLPESVTLEVRVGELTENPVAPATGKKGRQVETTQSCKPLELAGMVARYLLTQRKNATYWQSTRDTAMTIEALGKYISLTGELSAPTTVEVWLDGRVVKTVEITKENLYTAERSFALRGKALPTGAHTLEIRSGGKGPLYYNACVSYIPVDELITAKGDRIKVSRQYFKLVRLDVEKDGKKLDRVPLAPGSTVTSGDLVEVELTVESDGYYTYILFEDPKPAGFEPTELRSGYNGNGMGAYVEFRDASVDFFVSYLPKGKRVLTYRLRAEQPGQVSALPTRAEAMYAPDLHANSGEMRISTVDAPTKP